MKSCDEWQGVKCRDKMLSGELTGDEKSRHLYEAVYS